MIKTKKPIVITGATRSIDQLSPDGAKNFYDSIALAAHPSSRARGVMVCMNGKIYSSRGVIKTHTYGTDAIESYDQGFMGYVHGDTPVIYQGTARKHTYKSQFDISAVTELPRIEVIYGHAQMYPEMIDAAVEAGTQGIVYAGVGNGNLHPNVIPALKRAYKSGVRIVRSTRIDNGMVTKKAEVQDYSPDIAYIVSDNLTPQKARILLALSLLTTKNTKQIQQKFDAY